ncbi:hypothetical protein DUGA6_51720 [Duganella sp. HH105]|nr:hypothetical protein DUGA6_51720 [Duganella sp. HH105]
MSDTAASIPADDPQPPQPGDCCHSGCTFCVEDMYQDELDRYRAALKAWRERHPGRG